jgi:hypothetical protein
LLLPVKKGMLVLDIIAENISSDFLIINIVYALSIKDSVKLIKRSIDIIDIDIRVNKAPSYLKVSYEI